MISRIIKISEGFIPLGLLSGYYLPQSKTTEIRIILLIIRTTESNNCYNYYSGGDEELATRCTPISNWETS